MIELSEIQPFSAMAAVKHQVSNSHDSSDTGVGPSEQGGCDLDQWIEMGYAGYALESCQVNREPHSK